MAGILEQKRESGELPREYVYQEYPRMLHISKGVQRFDRQTEVIRGREIAVREWTEDIEVFEEVVVGSEAEEEAVLAGGRTEAQVEAERQELIVAARGRNIQVDPTWGLVRLQRELGAAPSSETIDALRTKVADLEEKAALRRRIADLEAQVAGRGTSQPVESAFDMLDDPEDIRVHLIEMGVEVDRRWGLPRLRQELEQAQRAVRAVSGGAAG